MRLVSTFVTLETTSEAEHAVSVILPYMKSECLDQPGIRTVWPVFVESILLSPMGLYEVKNLQIRLGIRCPHIRGRKFYDSCDLAIMQNDLETRRSYYVLTLCKLSHQKMTCRFMQIVFLYEMPSLIFCVKRGNSVKFCLVLFIISRL